MPMNAKPAPSELTLSVQLGSGIAACPVTRARLRRWVLSALSRDAVITLRLVGTREGRALNRDFRGRDYATNVLTFAYGAQDVDGADGNATAQPRAPRRTQRPLPPVTADIVLCVPVLRREAREQRKPLDHHLAHLVIHGVLHAQGHEHEHDDEAHEMESIETTLLRRLRIPDPYANETAPRDT